MLENKVAVVTGASRGIGRAIAIRLAKDGAAVIVNYNGSAAKAEEVVKEIESFGGKAEAIQCNVSEFKSAEEFLGGVVKKYGRVDILVNNAGITRDNLLMKMSEEEFDAVIDTNLKGAFNCIRHISRQMLRQKGGRIINISSVSALWEMQDRRITALQRQGSSALQRPRPESWQPRDHGKRHCSRIYQHRDDGRAFRLCERGSGSADPHEALWNDRGYREYRCVFGL